MQMKPSTVLSICQHSDLICHFIGANKDPNMNRLVSVKDIYTLLLSKDADITKKLLVEDKLSLGVVMINLAIDPSVDKEVLEWLRKQTVLFTVKELLKADWGTFNFSSGNGGRPQIDQNIAYVKRFGFLLTHQVPVVDRKSQNNPIILGCEPYLQGQDIAKYLDKGIIRKYLNSLKRYELRVENVKLADNDKEIDITIGLMVDCMNFIGELVGIQK